MEKLKKDSDLPLPSFFYISPFLYKKILELIENNFNIFGLYYSNFDKGLLQLSIDVENIVEIYFQLIRFYYNNYIEINYEGSLRILLVSDINIEDTFKTDESLTIKEQALGEWRNFSYVLIENKLKEDIFLKINLRDHRGISLKYFSKENLEDKRISKKEFINSFFIEIFNQNNVIIGYNIKEDTLYIGGLKCLE
ncbi:MAG: hypothetical protein ACPL1F_00950 [bacterium]